MSSIRTHKYWHAEEEQRLKDLLGAGTPLEECAQLLGRSADAVAKKIKRLGLQMPESKRKVTKGAFQALSWVRGLLADVKTLQDVKRVQVQVDQAREHILKTAAENFQKELGR